ncbi:MAG: hypothetical protein WC752_04095 [Patescibacteria group bacterium]
MIKVKLFSFLIFIGLIFFYQPVFAETTNSTCSDYTEYEALSAAGGHEMADNILYPLEVPIGNQLYIENLTDYITTVYNFAVSIAGILAVVVIMYGGLRWATSAGNEQTISSAKETIISAIVGLLLVLGSYVILNFISPQLTNLKAAQVPKIASTPELTCKIDSTNWVALSVPASSTTAAITISGEGVVAKGCPTLYNALKIAAANLKKYNEKNQPSVRSIEGTGGREVDVQLKLRMCYCRYILTKKCDDSFSMGFTTFSGCNGCNLAAEVCDGNEVGGPHLKGAAVDVSLYKDSTLSTLSRSQDNNSLDYPGRNCESSGIGCDETVKKEQQTLKAVMTGDTTFESDFEATGLKGISSEYWHFQLQNSTCNTNMFDTVCGDPGASMVTCSNKGGTLVCNKTSNEWECQ